MRSAWRRRRTWLARHASAVATAELYAQGYRQADPWMAALFRVSVDKRGGSCWSPGAWWEAQ